MRVSSYLPARSRSLLLVVAALLGSGCDVGDPAPPEDPCARSLDAVAAGRQRFRFQSESPAVTVWIEREYVEPGAGESSIYALRSFSVARDGACEDTQEPGALDYENTHHNWADRASAEIGGVRFTLGMDFVVDGSAAAPWRIWVRGEEVDTGAVALEEQELVPTGGPITCWQCPSFLPVWITEVLPDNDGATTDEAGDTDPWLELWNPSAEAVDLEGWRLETVGSGVDSWTFPAGTTIDRHGHLVVWLDGEPDEGALHASFSFPPVEGALRLVDERGATAGERVFTSPGAGRSLDLSLVDGVYVAADPPTPGATSSLQE